MVDEAIGSPYWNSERPTFLVGGGRSLSGFNFNRLRGRGFIVGINQSMLEIPYCDAGVSMDWPFATERRDLLTEFARQRPLYLAFGRIKPPIDGAHQISLPGSLTSGHVALRLAVEKRAKLIVLMGFDYRPGHYHIGYPWRRTTEEEDEQNLTKWALQFEPIANVEIWNASIDSRITVYPKCSIDKWC